jgi:GAF domain-containing protein
MESAKALKIFETLGDAFNSPLDSAEILERVAASVVENLEVTGCHFRLLSRDQRVLEHVAAHGLGRAFLDKGPVDAERSVAEALEGRVVWVEDCGTDPRIQYPQAFKDEGLVSMLTVPLQTRGQVIGMMRLFTADRREFTPEELDVISVVASMCATVIVHSMFQQILRHVAQSIRTSLDLPQVLSGIAGVISEDLRARGTFIGLISDDGRFEIAASSDLDDPLLRRIEGEPGAAIDAALAGEPVEVLDAGVDARVPWAAEARSAGCASLLCVPLSVHDQTFGALCVITHHPYDFSGDEVYLMGAVGEQCALAIRNAQMYAALKRRYQEAVQDFHQWFDHLHVPARPAGDG